MRDIFYNPEYKIGADKWVKLLNQAEKEEWNWICINKDLVEKHQKEIGLKDGWYLGRLLYALSSLIGLDSNPKYSRENVLQLYGKYENSLKMIPLHKSAKDICEKIILLNNIYSDKSIQDELNINEEQINSLIQKYQEELDIITITTKDIEDSEPKRIDYKTAVLRRADYLFYQMKVEGFKANHACLHMYSLYCKYEFDDIHLIEEEFNYESSLFDRINTQRKRALKHFEHRL